MAGIIYRDSAAGIASDQLRGFFVGWPNPPGPETYLRLLAHSDAVVLALDAATGSVVGFITAITDHVLAAYIPHLEVLPAYQGQGVGSTLVRRMSGPSTSGSASSRRAAWCSGTTTARPARPGRC